MTAASPREFPEIEGTRKRRRTVLACNECREKKRKCDGVKPICSACRRRDMLYCVWDEERINKVWNNQYIDSLKARIKELESLQLPPSHNDTVQLGAQPIPPETASTGNSHTNRGPLQTNLEAVRCPSDQFVFVSPKNQHEPHENHTATTNPSLDLPGWSLGIDHPIESKRTSPVNLDEREATATNNDDVGADAMGVISHLPPPNDGRNRRPSRYFGPSSTKGLLDNARTVIVNGRYNPLDQGTGDHCASQDSQGHFCESRNDDSVFGMAIPPRPEADELIESYWCWTHSLYPFIHRPSFEERYRTIWYPHIQIPGFGRPPSSGNANGIYATTSDRLFYCLLNTILSLGALLNPKIDQNDRSGIARSFYGRAKKLLDIDLLADGSLALVQTLLLMGQYLQSTEMSNSCWNVIGLAVRVAQCIWLHHDPRTCDQGCCLKQSFDQLEVEMRRRAWTGCVMLDRILSLTYGRPLMVHSTMSQRHLMLPPPIDNQYLAQCTDAVGSQAEGVPSLVDCYVQAVKLQEILGRVLTLFYHGDLHGQEEHSFPDFIFDSSIKGRVRNANLQQILNFDDDLIAWHNNLPVHLRIESHENNKDFGSVELKKREIFHRQSTVLEVRFLHIRLMILRPVLPSISDPETQLHDVSALLVTAPVSTNIEQEMLCRARETCMNVVQRQLRIIESNMYSTESLLPPPWYTILYIHTCALVLLTLLFLPPSKIGSAREVPISAFDRCLAALHAYEGQSRTARRCSHSLSHIRQSLFNNGQVEKLGLNANTTYRAMPITDNDDMLPAPTSSNDDVFQQYHWSPGVPLLSYEEELF